MCIFLFSNFSYKRRGVYRKKYLNEIWALIDGTDYLVSFLDTSESREYINRTSRGHLINSLPVLNLSEEELNALKKRAPHKPILRYKYNPSSSVTQSGTLYERFEMSRLAGLGNRGGNAESEIDNLVFSKKSRKRYSLPRLYKLTKGGRRNGNDEDEGEDASEDENNELDESNEIVDRAVELICDEEEEEEVENYDESNNNNDADNNNNNGDDTHNNGNDTNNNGSDTNINGNDTNNNGNDTNNNGNDTNNDDTSNIDNNSSKNNVNDIDKNQDNDDGYGDEILGHDIHLNRPYPPGLGPNERGIDAFDLQQRALREDTLSSDDGDERPSNCGCGHDGSGEVVLQVSLKNFIPAVNQEYNGDFTINNVPKAEWETIKAKGFNWILFEDLPPSTDFKQLSSTLHNCRLKLMMDYQSDELLQYFDGVRIRDVDIASYRSRFPDLTIVSVHSYHDSLKKSEEDNEKISKEEIYENDQNALKYATYVYDNRLFECLKNKDAEGFARIVRDETNENDRCHLLHYMCIQGLDFNPRSTRTAAAMLLTLPGMRVIDFSEIQLVDLVLIVLCKKAVRRGVFSFVNYTSTGKTFAWKYTRGKQHILIVANFDTRQTTTTIICDDCPTKLEYDCKRNKKEKVQFVDILSQTTYLRDPEEMRTTGLKVILYEYEAQIFEY
ncbi:hypothetical protein M9Y10_034697 [Tritrichomonas musculus]|uniref:Uncharacterized protein n=1 Tax=Tritrichomonas musculus TaxID=1915356 RepID=A0ABR2KGS6_9EUKA